MFYKITCLILWTLIGFAANPGVAADPQGEGAWQQALPGWTYRFPEDHAVHPEFKTEWWYFTGNVQDDQGRPFGYELTFFRQGVLSPDTEAELGKGTQNMGRFAQRDFKFAHFALSDLNNGKFYFTQKTNRGAFGEAGFGGNYSAVANGNASSAGQPLAWIEDWSLVPQADGAWHIVAEVGGDVPMSIDLRVLPLKGPVIEGVDGVSQKAAGSGNASHYYSFTRLQTTGTLALGKSAPQRNVHGESWFDHEWASNQLGPDQVGWDWFCFQFDDGTEMMLYAMRRKDGSVDPVSSGTWIEANGHSEHLRKEEFQLKTLRRWKSDRTGANYPVEWQVSVPSQQLSFSLKGRSDDQELALPLISYWEGAIAAEGKRAGRTVKGVGYMELTGYAAALPGLQNGERTAETGRGGGGR